MTEEYRLAYKAGKTEYRSKQAAGEYPYLPALDDIEPDAAKLAQQPLGIMEIPIEFVAGTKLAGRQNSFAANFMPILEQDTEFAMKWSSLCKAQIEEGFHDPIKVYEYLHRFYVMEGNKRVSVGKFLDMPQITADVTRLLPSAAVLAENPAYGEFMRFYNVSHLYDIECSWAGAYTEIAELLGVNLDEAWSDEISASLRSVYWKFSLAYKELKNRTLGLSTGDAFVIYLRIYAKDVLEVLSGDVIRKRIFRIHNEFLTENNNERVELVESSDKALRAGSIIEKAGGIVGKVIPVLSFTPKHPFKAAFIYDGRITDSSRTADHEEGRLSLAEAYGGIVATKCFEGCNSTELFEKAAEEAASWGANAVFSTSPSLIHDTLRAAIRYKDIRFLNCSVNLAHQAVRTYYARMYEAKFLAGLAAGAVAASYGTNGIGYCSDYPIYGTIAGINAFAIGASMTHPRAKIYLDWEGRRGANWWWDMVNRGIHVISAVDSRHSADGSDAHGLCYVERCALGEGNDLSRNCRITNLASPVYRWGKLYEIIIRTMIEGNYNAEAIDRKDRATNYWWGLASGVVDIECSDALPSNTKELVNTLKKDIIEGRFSPFEGELRSRERVVRRKDEPALTSRDIIMMDWLNENVIGEIPDFESLTDEAKSAVKFSGVEVARNQ